MLVATPELRFPLFGALGLGSGYYGVFPVDFTVFGDGGLAWDSQHQPWLFGPGSRPGVQHRRRAEEQFPRLRGGRSHLVDPSSAPTKYWSGVALQQGF